MLVLGEGVRVIRFIRVVENRDRLSVKVPKRESRARGRLAPLRDKPRICGLGIDLGSSRYG
ncbi:MAG: hypothetical protein U0174_23160 [Polyangiaceae bacterium]